jgi:hypothetical protein
MPPVIGQVEGVAGADGDSVRPLEEPLSPGSQKIPLPVKDHEGVFSPAENIDPVPRVHRRIDDLEKPPPLGKLGPFGMGFIGKFSSAHSDRHIFPLFMP